MAAGIIYQTVTTTTGETVELAFYVDETGAPTTWTPVTQIGAGTAAIGKLAANTGVDIGDVDVTSVVPGTGATNLGKAEDGAHTSGDVGVAILGVRRDTAASGAGTDGDYATLNLDSTGHLYVAIKDSQLDGSEYETVAASQTAQTLGATGGTGDFISKVVIIPATTSPGNVLLLDNATSITIFAGGASSVSTLHPFTVDLGMFSVSGAWKITTGANVSAIGIGNFT
jgi:hypothetical protein